MKYLLFLLALPAISFAQNSGYTSGAEKHQAFSVQQKRIASTPYKNLQWRLTGPDNKSGRATDVVGIHGNPSILYAAFATGGVWKTEDAGKNWKPLFDQQGTLSIGTLGLAPSNPNILYVGTGEANILRASLPGMGIYKSINGGKSFQFLGLENTGTIARIVVHPQDPNTLYVAATGNEWTYNKDRGVYKSVDGGKTWTKILFESEKSGCVDIVMDPYDPSILYASMWNRIRKRYSDPTPEDGDHIYKTIDGGKTWKKIGTGLPDTKFTGRIGLAIAPNDPNYVYAFVDDHTKKRDPKPGETDSYERQVQKVVIGGAIYRSTNKGESWEKMGEVHDYFKPFSGTYGWVFSQIRVHPTQKDRIYVLGVSMGVSNDGGRSWKQFIPVDTASEDIHGDNHALWIDHKNPDRIFLGNDGGISITYDGGNIWDNFFDKIPTTQFYTVTYDMEKPFNIFGAVQDEGTMSGSSANTFGTPQVASVRKWGMAPGGEGTQIQVDPVASNIVYSSSYYGRLMRTDMNEKNYRRRGTQFHTFDVGAIDSLRGEWLAGTLMSKFDRKTIYHGLQHLYKTTDGGSTWKMISPDLSYNDPKQMGVYPYLIYHQAICAIAEGTSKGEVYAGTDDGRVWATQNDGDQWIEITKGLPQHYHVAKIQTSAHKGRIYVVLNSRRQDLHIPLIYQSDDFGKTWRSISGDLPKSPANVVIEDKNGHLFCGTDFGAYYSNDGGIHWQSLNTNLPAAVSVNDMFIHPRDQKLVIGTYGRGVYILDDLSMFK